MASNPSDMTSNVVATTTEAMDSSLLGNSSQVDDEAGDEIVFTPAFSRPAVQTITVPTCSNPGCDQPGTKSCSACKNTVYCCVLCQTTDWPRHKEECPGQLRKVGMANLLKAKGFQRDRNWTQTIRYGEIAATKLQQLKDYSLENVQAMDDALGCKFDAFTFMGQHKEAMECCKVRYILWTTNHIQNSNTINSTLGLIQSCLLNKEFEEAERYGRHVILMINDRMASLTITEHQAFLADGSFWLARSILDRAKAGRIPPHEKQKMGEEAIAFARKAYDLHPKLFAVPLLQISYDMTLLADVLRCFNDGDDHEIIRLQEQSVVFAFRAEGSSSPNVASTKNYLGLSYQKRAMRAENANDLDRCMTNLELALSQHREAARIFRAINRPSATHDSLREVGRVEEDIRRVGIARAAAAGST